MWYESPLFLAPLTLIIGAIGAWIATWATSKKRDIERTDKVEDLEVQFRELRLQREDAKAQRETELETLRIQRAIDDEQWARALAERSRQTQALEKIATEQQKIASDVVEAVHLGNSSKSRMEAIEQDLRSQVKAADVAERHASQVSTTAMQTMKALAESEMKAKDARIDDLQRQLTTLALALPPTTPLAPQPADPVPVMLTDTEGVPAELPLTVVIQPPEGKDAP